MITQLKKQVKYILMNNPITRNSDITLTIEIWKKYYSVGNSVPVANLYDLPREDNVKRIRAKFCEEGYSWAMPTDLKVMRKRKINENKWKQALGYRVLDASNSVQYKVLNPDGTVEKIINIIK